MESAESWTYAVHAVGWAVARGDLTPLPNELYDALDQLDAVFSTSRAELT